DSETLFQIAGQRIALTGGAGVLGLVMARALAARGARLCLIDYKPERAERFCAEIEADGGRAIPVIASVTDRAQLDNAYDGAVQALGGIDVLINAAGGNRPEATTTPEVPFFNLPPEALRWV